MEADRGLGHGANYTTGTEDVNGFPSDISIPSSVCAAPTVPSLLIRSLVSSPDPSHDVTRLLAELQSGKEGAAEALVPLVYAELHALAVHFMRGERDDHTLQPTVLVHDAYLRLMGQHQVSWQNRAHFYGIAAQAMRRILVDHARRVRAAKREGGTRVTLDESVSGGSDQSVDLIALDDALEKLAVALPRQARVVELRYFSGLDIDETAEVLSISPATVKRDWTFAKAFLHRALDLHAS
ncbi:MAG: sigma-70 family RNA polymerase sigma factor [Gemmatimonadaceae bacterium]|nr:sigma-70 family RNA polymerase sigma factor [Gemmatimonadaceae bacterium]